MVTAMFDARELRHALLLAICGTAIVVALFALIVEAHPPSSEASLHFGKSQENALPIGRP
jgi:hypothetical protein